MAMDTKGGAGGIRSDINITPLVDVVLVLLIIFMVAVPLLQMGYPVQVPPKVQTPTTQPDNDQIIVRLDENGHAFINKFQVEKADFPGRLRQALTGRQTKVVFFAADGELPYDTVVSFMDICRDSGAQNLGIVFEDMKVAPAGAPAAAAPATP
ncbi:MAG TPA: biopolymer transporter ExbD [Thermoanaerobaculia bacterium]|nr:biopolymer transporter ExbD [Thermoanaerobaculia bacterium]